MNSLLDLDILYKYSQIKGPILVANYSKIYVKCLKLVKPGQPGDRDESIPQIASALRSCVNRRTGFTPNMLMLGREIAQPVDLVYPLTQDILIRTGISI